MRYILECQRCGKQQKTTTKPESDKICPRCGDIMGPLTANQISNALKGLPLRIYSIAGN